ncbi:MAG TPA: hypothetical protein VN577_01160, partial [Terriglobales bacterium]|nr:hypothetical protein [Terriglobales bacterium]
MISLQRESGQSGDQCERSTAAAQVVQRGLGGEGTNAWAVAQEDPVMHLTAGGIGHGHVDRTDGDLFAAVARSGRARDGHCVCGTRAAARTERHGFGGFGTDG